MRGREGFISVSPGGSVMNAGGWNCGNLLPFIPVEKTADQKPMHLTCSPAILTPKADRHVAMNRRTCRIFLSVLLTGVGKMPQWLSATIDANVRTLFEVTF